MNNKFFLSAIALTLALAIFWFLWHSEAKDRNNRMETVKPVSHSASALHTRISDKDAAPRAVATRPQKKVKEPDLPPPVLARWRELEELGHLPPCPNVRDLRLAVLTSWWGQTLDPTNFWKGRPIWQDDVSVRVAGMFGRTFPPLPPGDYHLPVYHERKRTDAERLTDSMSMTIPPGESTSEERAFWEVWRRTHPNPPEKIEEVQFKTAGDLLAFQGAEDVDLRARIIRRRVEAGIPPEAFTEEALKWALVEGVRRQQLKDEQEGHTKPGVLSGMLVGRMPVDAQYALRDLTAQERKAADTWKFPYLRRLRAENTDEMYIQAYLKAWDLNEKDVFGP